MKSFAGRRVSQRACGKQFTAEPYSKLDARTRRKVERAGSRLSQMILRLGWRGSEIA
jgi:hypothetical protein